jgi:hypothetical protein
VRLEEGAERSVDPGLVATPRPLEPGEQVGIEAQPDLLAPRLGVLRHGVLVSVAGNVGPVGVARDRRLELRLDLGHRSGSLAAATASPATAREDLERMEPVIVCSPTKKPRTEPGQVAEVADPPQKGRAKKTNLLKRHWSLGSFGFG